MQRFIQTLGSRFDALLADWPHSRQQEALATLHALAEILERGRDVEVEPRAAEQPAGDAFP